MDRIASPAQRVIEKCGNGNFEKGLVAISGWTGVSAARVRRWTFTKSKGGTGGVIPTQHQQDIYDRARLKGVDLKAEDFFFTAGELSGAAA